MKILINKSIVKTKTYDMTLSDEDIGNEEHYLGMDSALLTKYAIDHQLSLKESYYNFVLYEQKITLDEISVNEVLSILSDLIDFKLEYITRGKGCEVCFELTERDK